MKEGGRVTIIINGGLFMNKFMRLMGTVCLTLLIMVCLTTGSISASSMKISNDGNDFELAASRIVSESIIYQGTNANPPDTYYYSDRFGYSGYIPLDYVIRDHTKNQTVAVYTGTVYCEGDCPMIQRKIE